MSVASGYIGQSDFHSWVAPLKLRHGWRCRQCRRLALTNWRVILWWYRTQC